MTATPTQPYDLLVFIGRFQPFHLGHKAVIDRALELSARVVVLVGSASRARSLRNPFNWQERSDMILGAYAEEQRRRILIQPLRDMPYSDEAWERQVREAVRQVADAHATDGEARIGLIGHNKDNTSYYLAKFPEWTCEDVGRAGDIDATGIRTPYLRALAERTLAGFADRIADQLPASSLAFLRRFADDAEAGYLADEWIAIDRYQAAWSAAPYPQTFVTVDAVVVQAGHVLGIRRKHAPGRGRVALPGGFVEPYERLEDAVARELAEETQIGLSAVELKRLIRAHRVFDEPNRSDRGRTITHGFLIEIPDGGHGLTAIEASDDAEAAFWTPIGDLQPEAMFEDHWDIVQELLGARS